MTQSEFNINLIELRPRLQQQAIRFTKNRDDADDLIQETYLKALRYQSQLKDSSSIRRWLFVVLHNTFINKYRKDRKQSLLTKEISNLHFLGLYDSVDPNSCYQEIELKERIEELKSIYREPLKMYIEGWKYEEIGEKLGVKMGTIKSRIHLARRELMKSIIDNK